MQRLCLWGCSLAVLVLTNAAGGEAADKNEAAAVSACKAYADAQDVYRRTDYNKDGMLEYAQSIAGGKGKFGLFTDGVEGAEEGKLGLVAAGIAGASVTDHGEEAKPHAGYLFKILTKQGAAAPGGKRSYIANEHMTLGYALLAYPAEYGTSGKHAYIISNVGTVFKKDLGKEGTEKASEIDEYNPDESWKAVE